MSKLPVDAKDRPLQLVTISHCGELERKVKTGELTGASFLRAIMEI